MEIKSIVRNYANSFKFVYKSKHNEQEYNELCDDFLKNITIEKGNMAKKIVISYFEETLHILASYYFMFKWIVPIILFLLVLIFHNNNIMSLVLGVMALVSLYIVFFLKKKYKITCFSYSFEMTAINNFLNQKYNTDIDIDFDKLGKQYLQKIIK
jgi:hypothetical protein